jgi:hypothetical protein
MTSTASRLAAMFPRSAESIAEELEFEMSGMDDDELDEADAQACWALEVQSQVELMNHRSRF